MTQLMEPSRQIERQLAPAKMQWVVRLGRTEWARFTYERTGEDGLTLLGSVKRGARIGALAVHTDGSYVQVNGDYLSPLNARHIRAAISRAEIADRKRARAPDRSFEKAPERAAAASTAAAPVVIIKRRRILSGGPSGSTQ
jgi:hypothetical protein